MRSSRLRRTEAWKTKKALQLRAPPGKPLRARDFWTNLAALLKVKTIITLVIIAVLAVLSINGSIEPDKFLTIATMVVAFYFGTQNEKKS